MKIDVSQGWKGVVVMVAAMVVFVGSAQAFALGSGSEHHEVDAPFEVEPTAADQGDAPFDVESTAELDGRHLQGGAHHLLDMGADPELLGASVHTGADPSGTVEATTWKAVTLSANIRDPSGVTGSIDFTFEIEALPDALDLPAGDVLVGFPATFPTQRVTLKKETSSIPEPAVLVLVGLGVIGLALLRRRWGRRTHP